MTKKVILCFNNICQTQFKYICTHYLKQIITKNILLTVVLTSPSCTITASYTKQSTWTFHKAQLFQKAGHTRTHHAAIIANSTPLVFKINGFRFGLSLEFTVYTRTSFIKITYTIRILQNILLLFFIFLFKYNFMFCSSSWKANGIKICFSSLSLSLSRGSSPPTCTTQSVSLKGQRSRISRPTAPNCAEFTPRWTARAWETSKITDNHGSYYFGVKTPRVRILSYVKVLKTKVSIKNPKHILGKITYSLYQKAHGNCEKKWKYKISHILIVLWDIWPLHHPRARSEILHTPADFNHHLMTVLNRKK